MNTGVKQGCLIAPTLFSIFLTAVLQLVSECMQSGVKTKYRFIDIFNVRRLRAKTETATEAIHELQYADDNMIMAHSKEELQLAVTAFNTT